MPGRVFRPKADRLPEGGDGPVIVFLLIAQDRAEVRVRLPERRVQANRFPKLPDGLVRLAVAVERLAQSGARQGVIRLEADRFPVSGDGLIQLVLVKQGFPKPGVRRYVVRVEAEGVLIRSESLVRVAPALQRITEVGVSFRIVPLEADRLPEGRNGSVIVALCVTQHGTEVV